MHDTHEVSLSARSFRASLVSIRAASRGALRAIHAVEQLYLSHNAHAGTKSVKMGERDMATQGSPTCRVSTLQVGDISTAQQQAERECS